MPTGRAIPRIRVSCCLLLITRKREPKESFKERVLIVLGVGVYFQPK